MDKHPLQSFWSLMLAPIATPIPAIRAMAWIGIQHLLYIG